MADRYADILVVDLLGGVGDLLMLLPAIHGLARRNPGAALRLLTHEPGADLVRGDPAVTEVCTAGRGPGAARRAVARVLADRTPDLAVSTTRYDGIPALLAASGARCVTDLWRRPPPDELVTDRYLRILRAEGLLAPTDTTVTSRVFLTAAERVAGERVVARCLGAARRPPVVLVTDAGMAIKRWPDRHWRRLATILAQHHHPVLGLTANPYAAALPAGDLRQVAARFAAVGARRGVVVGADTGPVRLAAAAGARTMVLFGPTLAARYGLGPLAGRQVQGLPDCPYRRPTAITEQVCWWDAACPLTGEPACMADIAADDVAATVLAMLRPR